MKKLIKEIQEIWDEDIKRRIIIGTFIIMIALIVTLCLPDKKEQSSKSTKTNTIQYLKDHSSERFASMGFKVVGYEGYLTNHDPHIYFLIEPMSGNGLYRAFLKLVDGEIHVYDLKRIDCCN